MATAELDAYYLYRRTSDTGRVALSSPTSLFGSGVDSSISTLEDIGFTFNFNNVDFTQFAACTDGYIQLDGADPADFTNDLIEADNKIILCPWWDDLRTMGNGLRYELQGSEPNRQLVVDFDCQIFWNDSNPNLKFQVILYETTNRIEFRYDDPDSSDPATSNASVGIKIEIADNTGTNADGKFRDFIGSTVAPYNVENNANGGWSQVMRDGAVVKIPNNTQVGTEGRDFPGDPSNVQQSQQYYFLFSPDEEGGGGGGGTFPNTQSPPTGVKISADFTDNQMSQLVTQYDRGANQEAYVPFRLSVRGPSNLRLRPTDKVYKITKD